MIHKSCLLVQINKNLVEKAAAVMYLIELLQLFECLLLEIFIYQFNWEKSIVIIFLIHVSIHKKILPQLLMIMCLHGNVKDMGLFTTMMYRNLISNTGYWTR